MRFYSRDHTHHSHVLNAGQSASRVRLLLHEYVLNGIAQILLGGADECVLGRIHQLLADSAEQIVEVHNFVAGRLRVTFGLKVVSVHGRWIRVLIVVSVCDSQLFFWKQTTSGNKKFGNLWRGSRELFGHEIVGIGRASHLC